MKTIQNHRKIVHKLPLPKTVDLGNTPINIICHMGMVTRLHSSHSQALCSFISTLHSRWHTVRNQPPAQAKNIQVMGHSCKDMTSTKVIMVGLKCTPLPRFQDKGHHLQVHRIPKEKEHLIDLEWTEHKQAKLKMLVVWYTSQGASGACRVHRWRLACFS